MNLNDMPQETAHESGGYVKGVAVAVVTQNQDPDGLGRVKVRFPWHEQPRESYWARLAMPMAGKNRGMVTIPEVDDEVLVAFEREDLRFPCILGSLYNGQDKPPVANDDGNNDRRIWQSRAESYLLFYDGTDNYLELKRKQGERVLLGPDGILVEDGRGNKLEILSGNGDINLIANGTLTIQAAMIKMEASGTLEVKAGATLTLRGSLVNIN